MKLFSKKISKEIRQVFINETLYKVNIIYEKRRNSRVSITKTGINIRVISFISKKEKELQIQKFLDWAEKTIKEKNITFTKHLRQFVDGEELILYDKTVELKILEIEGRRVFGKINPTTLDLKIPKIKNAEEKDKYVSKIIARLIASNYKEKISEKLHIFNDKHKFGTLNNVRLKNNSTNWGSCSSKNNINISIRLLLAPEWVVDYVLIHELSHLKHRNHSASFWNEVYLAYPNFKEAEKWLKVNAKNCVI
ncbi:MAG: putative metal-dependent hydrolase [Planctomycetota bacterium]|jgi:predicted metal-dependent hydrolase